MSYYTQIKGPLKEISNLKISVNPYKNADEFHLVLEADSKQELLDGVTQLSNELRDLIPELIRFANEGEVDSEKTG